jgi:DGQHR domain-containing protein
VFGPIISPSQGSAGQVVCFAARPRDIARIARIERIGRDEDGKLRGFQRPRIASHIREIRDYLAKPEAILPNAIVLAFNEGVKLQNNGTIEVDVSSGPPGWVVDGQQRLSAALDFTDKPFELIVSAFICNDMAELNRQFILVNNTRPLGKPLIYELLPGTSGLPLRLSNRMEAAVLTEALNYRPESVLRGLISQHTNPNGVIKDTLIQRALMNSMQDGALRNRSDDEEGFLKQFSLINEFFLAVAQVFHHDWHGHTPKSSRLLHGVGIISMGYVMDELHERNGARKRSQFVKGLAPLRGRTQWTSGEWRVGQERRMWNSLQNTSADYRLISHHLVRLLRRASKHSEL